MIPSNIYKTPALKGPKGLKRGSKLPLCHSAMIPWTADFIVGLVRGELGSTNGNGEVTEGEDGWDADRLLVESRDNARLVYGI